MKKTFTVNLGGTIFNIDSDAYQLLDDYLSNLRLYFRKQEDADEIVHDIESRISELLSEKVSSGSQVITLAFVEEVIERMGKPEEFAGVEAGSEHAAGASPHSGAKRQGAAKRLYRDPDNKMLGGVISGFAAYLGCDTTLLRLLAIALMFVSVGAAIIIYIICWLLMPPAHTAAEKLSMRGEEVTIENIGRTVKTGFEKVSNGVNDFVNSGKPRTFFQKVADILVAIAGFVLKVCLVLLLIICSPVLFILAIVFIALIIALVAALIGGGAILYEMFPSIDWVLSIPVSPLVGIVAGLSGLIAVVIPLIAIVFAVLRKPLKWKPMATGLKWTLFFLWISALAVFLICYARVGGGVTLLPQIF